MRCDHDLLLDYLDGELDGARRREVEEHLASCDDCRRAAEAYEADLALVDEALGAGDDDPLTDVELEALLAAPDLQEDAASTEPRRRPLFGHPRAVAALALAASVAAALLLMPPPSEETYTIPPSPAAVAEADERVEIRMATGNPSIQVIWVMSKDVDF